MRYGEYQHVQVAIGVTSDRCDNRAWPILATFIPSCGILTLPQIAVLNDETRDRRGQSQDRSVQQAIEMRIFCRNFCRFHRVKPLVRQIHCEPDLAIAAFQPFPFLGRENDELVSTMVGDDDRLGARDLPKRLEALMELDWIDAYRPHETSLRPDYC